MSARRILTISLLISLLGHLVVFTTFSVATFKKETSPSEVVRVAFLGNFVKEKPSLRVESVVREEGMPPLQPIVKELEVGPGLSLNKPRPTVPVPRISVEGIISILKDEEGALLEVKVNDDEMKERPPEKLYLLEKEQKE